VLSLSLSLFLSFSILTKESDSRGSNLSVTKSKSNSWKETNERVCQRKKYLEAAEKENEEKKLFLFKNSSLENVTGEKGKGRKGINNRDRLFWLLCASSLNRK
jgi:hypothetical protein